MPIRCSSGTANRDFQKAIRFVAWPFAASYAQPLYLTRSRLSQGMDGAWAIAPVAKQTAVMASPKTLIAMMTLPDIREV